MIEIERIEEIKFNTGDTYNLADFNKIYRSFNEIKSVSESLDVMLDLYESLSKYLCMIAREVDSTGSRRNRSKRILNKYISYFHSNMEGVMNVLIMKNDKFRSPKSSKKYKKECLKYIHRIENVIYGENSKIVYHYLCVNLDINELDFSVEGIKPIYLMIQLIEGFAAILKKNLLLY